jgi:hypothetical protein
MVALPALESKVETAHLIFACHLDVGFTGMCPISRDAKRAAKEIKREAKR